MRLLRYILENDSSSTDLVPYTPPSDQLIPKASSQPRTYFFPNTKSLSSKKTKKQISKTFKDIKDKSIEKLDYAYEEYDKGSLLLKLRSLLICSPLTKLLALLVGSGSAALAVMFIKTAIGTTVNAYTTVGIVSAAILLPLVLSTLCLILFRSLDTMVSSHNSTVKEVNNTIVKELSDEYDAILNRVVSHYEKERADLISKNKKAEKIISNLKMEINRSVNKISKKTSDPDVKILLVDFSQRVDRIISKK